MITVTVEPEHAGARLDRVVHESLSGVSRAEAQRLIEDGHVTVDGALRSRSSRVQRGMVVVIDVPEKVVVEEEAPVDLEPRIVFEDDYLVVVDKPVGLVTHAAPSSKGPSLAGILAARGMAAGGDEDRPGLEERMIDTATPEALALTEEIRATVSAAIDRLPEDLRTAIMLRELEGLSYEEIAKTMDCPVGTVRSRIFRAREAVDEQLREIFEGGLGRGEAIG